MAELKLTISDPKTGKTANKEIKDADSQPFIGLNIGETINGEAFGIGGFEFKITGGSDKCGFPMRRGIKGVRKRIATSGGVGFKRKLDKGIKVRKTLCGHKINEDIRQINLMVTKGADIMKALGATEAPKEGAKEAPKEGEAKPEEKPKEEAKPKEKPPEEKKSQDSKKPEGSEAKPQSEEPKKEAPKAEKK